MYQDSTYTIDAHRWEIISDTIAFWHSEWMLHKLITLHQSWQDPSLQGASPTNLSVINSPAQTLGITTIRNPILRVITAGISRIIRITQSSIYTQSKYPIKDLGLSCKVWDKGWTSNNALLTWFSYLCGPVSSYDRSRRNMITVAVVTTESK